jgi:hypothetical protein
VTDAPATTRHAAPATAYGAATEDGGGNDRTARGGADARVGRRARRGLAGHRRPRARRVPRVSDHARDAVLRAAAELSYVTNRAARSLMTRRSDSIAFVVAEPEERFFADPFFSLVLRGVHAAVAAHDVQLVFAVLTDDAERERFARFARGATSTASRSCRCTARIRCRGSSRTPVCR